MRKFNQLFAIALMLLMVSAALAQQMSAQKKHNNPSPAAAAPSVVSGSGTAGQLTKWTSFSTLGDSTIFEDKFGNLGIGTTAPASKLTVKGMIETTLGGLKFPDSTVQTTAALSSIFHDATLKGNGTSAQPLGIAVPLTLTGSTGSSGVLVEVTNTGIGDAARFQGGNGDASHIARHGVVAIGGSHTSPNNLGGMGVSATGGDSSDGFGGNGVEALGGAGSGPGHFGGAGIYARRGFAFNGATDGKAGVFDGSVDINKFNNTGGDLKVAGNLNVTGTKNFKIDHPLDPENKVLYHAAIESSEVLNVYSGNVTTDQNGDAVVQLPDWFEAINRDFRYQLTVIGSFNQAIVAGKIKNNAFAIKTNGPGVEVSWQVTGVRNDAVMKAYPFKVEEAKAEPERGYYLSPDAYNLSEEKGIEYVRNPELMRRVKEAREKAQKEKLQ